MNYQYIVCQLDAQTLAFIGTNQTIINEGRVVNCKEAALPFQYSETSGVWVCTQFFCVFVTNSESEIADITANCTVVESLSIENFYEKYLPA